MPLQKTDAPDPVVGIIQLANLLNRRLAPAISRYRITPQQWGVLSAIADESAPPTMAEVSRLLMVSKQNITGMITRLETLGLIRRAADPEDLRAVRIQLTRKGQQVVGSVTPIYRRWIDQALSDLSSGERKTLGRAVTRLITALSDEP
jgi:DNA-binding MarR family transcriptional regulator